MAAEDWWPIHFMNVGQRGFRGDIMSASCRIYKSPRIIEEQWRSAMSRCEVTLSYLAALMGRVNEAPAAVPSVLSPARHVVRERTKLHTGTIESGTNRCDILDSSFLMVLGETSFSQFYRHNSRTHQEFRLSSGNHLSECFYTNWSATIFKKNPGQVLMSNGCIVTEKE